MPGGSSAMKEEPIKAGSPPFLLGAAGSAVGSAGQDNQVVDPVHGHTSHGLRGGESKYHSSKLEFLALKWGVICSINPSSSRLTITHGTYVMATPNLDAIGHRWVAAMVRYNFEIEYVCGSDNKVVADALSRVGGYLEEDAVQELLDQGTIKELLNHAVHYGIPRAEADDPRVTQEHEKTEGEIIMQV